MAFMAQMDGAVSYCFWDMLLVERREKHFSSFLIRMISLLAADGGEHQ